MEYKNQIFILHVSRLISLFADLQPLKDHIELLKAHIIDFGFLVSL